ncbi:hypothetical protein TNCV_2974501 [Trichonephila clavipes]|nr:hypothetical protein TNCV_2974501 [Trichonephila clavipes]
MESMIRLTTSASTIESPIIRNTLTLKPIEFPLRSAIVRVFVVTSHLPPIFLPIPVRETIVLTLVCISEFPTRTPDLSIRNFSSYLITCRRLDVVCGCRTST